MHDSGLAVVSIHAPVKGATELHGADGGDFVVSIHAPVKGATQFARWRLRSCLGFNPRAREGRDLRRAPWCTHYGLFQSTRP